MGKNESEKIKIEQCLEQIMDLRNDMVWAFYCSSKVWESQKNWLLSSAAPTHLTKMENWLQRNKSTYCVSDSLCFADFHLWELIDQLEIMTREYEQDSLIADKEKLRQFYTNIKGMDKLSAYFQSNLYKLPINA